MQPQTRAESIGKYGCLSMCYLYCLGIEGVELINCTARAMERGLLDSECTVLNAEDFLLYFSGRRFKVTKQPVKTLKNIKNPTPVRFDYNGNSHWVVVENGEIVFNSLDNSQCVKLGLPVTARVMELVINDR